MIKTVLISCFAIFFAQISCESDGVVRFVFLKLKLDKTSLYNFKIKKLQYKKYLNEVVSSLENDPIFKKLLQNSSYEEIVVSI